MSDQKTVIEDVVIKNLSGKTVTGIEIPEGSNVSGAKLSGLHGTETTSGIVVKKSDEKGDDVPPTFAPLVQPQPAPPIQPSQVSLPTNPYDKLM